jgi:hypothetical protein
MGPIQIREPRIVNDPVLLRPVGVRVVRPFYVGGTRAEIGEIVILTHADARSLVATGKAEWVK